MAESGRFGFFTQIDPFPIVDVIVDRTRGGKGRKFLRTNADPTTGNNLTALDPF